MILPPLLLHQSPSVVVQNEIDIAGLGNCFETESLSDWCRLSYDREFNDSSFTFSTDSRDCTEAPFGRYNVANGTIRGV